MEGSALKSAVSVETAALVKSLAKEVKGCCPQIDLLVALTQEQELDTIPEIALPLAESLGLELGDVCCLLPHQLPPDLGSEKWHVLTTHGHAQVVCGKDGFEAKTCQGHLSPRDSHYHYQLVSLRNRIMREFLGLSDNEAPYARVQGNVVLCGDFTLWPKACVLALRQIFYDNGASKIFFATPVIGSGRCRDLTRCGCQIIRIHPPQLRLKGAEA